MDPEVAVRELYSARLLGHHHVDRHSPSISPADFTRLYMAPNFPVVLGGLCEEWNAVRDWRLKGGDGDEEGGSLDYDFFLDRFGSCIVNVYNVHDGACRTTTVTEYAAEIRSSGVNRGEYLKDWHQARAVPDYLAYTVPPHFADDWLNAFWDHQGVDDFRFTYLGPKHSWTPLHHDVYLSYSWSANVVGRKLWILFPPTSAPLLKNQRGELMKNVLDADVREFPDRDDALRTGSVVWQEAGEAIFVPSGWLHQVHNLSEPTVSINHNWCNGHNIEQMCRHIHEELVCVIAELASYQFDGDEIPDSEACQRLLLAEAGMDFALLWELLAFQARRLLTVTDEQHSENPMPLLQNILVLLVELADTECLKGRFVLLASGTATPEWDARIVEDIRVALRLQRT